MPKTPCEAGSASSAAGMLTLLALLASCRPPERAGGSTVLFASGADLQSINPLLTVHPLAKQVQKHVLFLPLAGYDSAMRPMPRLAEFEWSPDRRTLTFRLRRDVRWHDGVPTTASDARFTLELARRPETAYPRARDLAAITAVEASDSFTLRVRFARAQPTFPDVLTDLAILPAHRFSDTSPAALRAAPFNREPVGNGPFEFVEYRPNQRWVFRRHGAFPSDLGRPALDRLVVVVVDEATTKLAALSSGDLDFAGISPAHAEFVRGDERLAVVDYPVQFLQVVIWNLRRSPFDDPRLRAALDHAIDRRVIVDAFLNGFGVLAGGPVMPEHPWHEPVEPPRYDPVLAAVLLDSAGWTAGDDGVRTRGGRRLEFSLLTVGSADNALEQMLQAQLQAVGVRLVIRQLELAAFLGVAQGRDREFDALVTGLPGDLSLGHVIALLSGDGPLAYPGYRSAAFDAAIGKVQSATTEADLREAWQAAQRIVARDRPVSWLYHSRGLQGVNRRVRGVSIDLRGELASVSRWSVDSGR